jgi:heme/copper-type cytochrome/quinol oxidase subunit 2
MQMSTSGYPQWSGDPEGYPAQGPDTPPARGNGLAVAALVLGIVACLLFWTVFGGIVLGVLAVIFGIVGARRARGGRAPHRGMSITGLVLGALGLIASAVIIVAGVSILNSDSFKDYNDCVKHAQTQSDRDQCAKDFSHRVNNN